MLTKEKIYLIEEQTGVRQNELRRSLNEELRGGARKGPQQSAAGLYRDGYPQGFQMMGNDGNMYYLNHQRMGKNNKMTAKWVKVKNTYQQPKKSKAPKKKLPKKGGKKSGGKSKFMRIDPNDCPAQFYMQEGEDYFDGKITWSKPTWQTVRYTKNHFYGDKGKYMFVTDSGAEFHPDSDEGGMMYGRYKDEANEHVFRVYNKPLRKAKVNKKKTPAIHFKTSSLSWGVEIQPKKAGKKNNDNFDLDDYDSDQDDDDISSPKKKGLKCNDAGECIDCCDEGLKGDITDSKKYCNRNSPPYAANHYKCRGTTKEGNDGNMYTSTANKNGVYTWKKSKAFKREKWGKEYGKPPTSLAKSQKVIDTVLQFVQKPILAAAFKKHATPYNSAFKEKHGITAKDTVYVVNSNFKIVKAQKITENLYVYDQSFLQKLFEIIS